MPRPPPPTRTPPWPQLAAAAIVLAVAAIYANSLGAPFVFDDGEAIVHNASIRDLGDLGAVLSPPHGGGVTVEGRPVLNLSLALNYAISGTDVWSYHVLNGLIHALAAITLFGIVRRTLRRVPGLGPSSPEGSGAGTATALGFAVALLWAVHPLQTEAVTYVIQRAESLMGLCYLLTLYGFIRAAESAGGKASGLWLGLSCLACLLGMGTKEVMISAPLIVLLYDRAFVSGSLGEALRRRWRYYAVLAILGAALIVHALGSGTRGGMAGFGINVGPWTYWQTQFQAVGHYLWLSFWPRTLVFDYGVQWAKGPADVVPYALAVGALAIAAGAALWRRHASGFIGACFFAILAPTSVIPGNRQTLAEHRMYLPLAAVIALTVCGGFLLIPAERRRRLLTPGWILLAASAAVLAALTVRRNEDYRSELALFRDTVEKRPGNASAHTNLGNLLRDNGNYDAAITQYEEALRLKPDYSQAQYDLGIALADSGRMLEAIPHYEEALRLKPGYAEAENNLGIALSRTGRPSEGVGHLAEAVRLDPSNVEAHCNLGLVLAQTGRFDEAVTELRKAIGLNPSFYPAHATLALVFQALGRNREAADQFEAASRLRPGGAGGLRN